MVGLAAVSIIEVDNPHYSRDHHGTSGNPKKIQVSYNPNESYVGYLYSKSLINEACKKAGDRVRQAYERIGGAGARAIDYSKEPVDGGSRAQDIPDQMIEAGRLLREVHGVLGPQGHSLVLDLAGAGLWPRDLAPRDSSMQRYLSMRFRECLESLAVHWGYMRRPMTFHRMTG